MAGSSLRVAVASGLISALAVCGVLYLATDGFEDEPERERAATPAHAAADVPSLRDVYARARLGVVLVELRPPGIPPRTGPPRRDDGIATGSGFLIDSQGHVVTNAHVVPGRGELTVQFDEDEDPVEARLVGRDRSTDLALLRIDPADAPALRPLPLGDSRTVRVGDAALAIGYPFGLERTLTVGVVSATDRTIDAPDGDRIRRVVQTDAPINAGNSGGPLLDDGGRVIGVNSQSRGNGLGFAVPADTVERLVRRLKRAR